MVKSSQKLLLILLCFLVTMVADAGPAQAQANVVNWLRNDVNLTLQQNSGLNVEEIHEVALVSGATEFTRILPSERYETISNIQVSEINPSGGQRGYVQADTKQDYTFEYLVTSNEEKLVLHFPPNSVASTRFVIRYFLGGAVRFYEDGDRLDWQPFGPSAPKPIGSSAVTMNLPEGFSPEQLKQSSSGVPTEKFIPNATRAIFSANGIAAGDELEVSLEFPHGVIQGSPPAWQRDGDRLSSWTPVLRWGSILLGLLLVIGGPAAAYGWWMFQNSDVRAATAKGAKYLRMPPNRESPAIGGLLLEGKSKPRHLTAVMLDLAARGALHVYPPEFDDDGRAREFDMYGVDQEKASKRTYEETIYTKIFGFQGGRQRNLGDVRRTLYMAVPEIKGQIEAEMAETGFIAEGTQVARRQYLAFGGATAIFSLVVAILAAGAFSRFTFLVVCPCLGLMVGAIAFMLVGWFKPKTTEEGAEQLAKWAAFRRYLQDINAKEANKFKDRFSALLPYAVAFGLEKSFVPKFAGVKTDVPPWWSIPEERRPDTSHEDSYAWVSAGDMAPQSQAGSDAGGTQGGVRRLGDKSEEAPAVELLQEMQPDLMALIKAGLDVFGKAPAVEEEIDFDALGEDKA